MGSLNFVKVVPRYFLVLEQVLSVLRSLPLTVNSHNREREPVSHLPDRLAYYWRRRLSCMQPYIPLNIQTNVSNK